MIAALRPALACVLAFALCNVISEVTAQEDVEELEVEELDVEELDVDDIPPTAEEGCFIVRNIRDFDALSDNFVFVSGLRDEENYLLTMFTGCFGLRDAFGIAIASRMSRVCSNSAAEIRYRSLGRIETCPIVKVERVEDKTAAERLVESRSRD